MPGDAYSLLPAQSGMLSRIIEYTGNVIIGSGGLDMLMSTNGTLLVLQNVTWNGMQGFRERPGEVVSCSARGGTWLVSLTDAWVGSSSHRTMIHPTRLRSLWLAWSAPGVRSADSRSMRLRALGMSFRGKCCVAFVSGRAPFDSGNTVQLLTGGCAGTRLDRPFA